MSLRSVTIEATGLKLVSKALICYTGMWWLLLLYKWLTINLTSKRCHFNSVLSWFLHRSVDEYHTIQEVRIMKKQPAAELSCMWCINVRLRHVMSFNVRISGRSQLYTLTLVLVRTSGQQAAFHHNSSIARPHLSSLLYAWYVQEYQRHRNTETQRHRETETKTQRQRETETKREKCGSSAVHRMSQHPTIHPSIHP